MKAVFDTNILIDYLNGFKEAAVELALYQTRIVSIITYIEVLVGAKNAEEKKAIRGFLGSFKVQELSNQIADEAISIRQSHRLKIPDAIVYATARTEGCILVSRNTKDLKAEWPDVRFPYQI